MHPNLGHHDASNRIFVDAVRQNSDGSWDRLTVDGSRGYHSADAFMLQHYIDERDTTGNRARGYDIARA